MGIVIKLWNRCLLIEEDTNKKNPKYHSNSMSKLVFSPVFVANFTSFAPVQTHWCWFLHRRHFYFQKFCMLHARRFLMLGICIQILFSSACPCSEKLICRIILCYGDGHSLHHLRTPSPAVFAPESNSDTFPMVAFCLLWTEPFANCFLNASLVLQMPLWVSPESAEWCRRPNILEKTTHQNCTRS